MNGRQNFLLNDVTAKTGWTTASALVVASFLVAGPSRALHSDSVAPAEVSVATQIREVQRGTVDGRDFLSVNIGGHEIGPSTCRSNILRMDSAGDTAAERQVEIETIAFTAMLTASTVMVVVPLEADQCVDGKPTFTDLYQVSPR